MPVRQYRRGRQQAGRSVHAYAWSASLCDNLQSLRCKRSVDASCLVDMTNCLLHYSGASLISISATDNKIYIHGCLCATALSVAWLGVCGGGKGGEYGIGGLGGEGGSGTPISITAIVFVGSMLLDPADMEGL